MQSKARKKGECMEKSTARKEQREWEKEERRIEC